MAGASITITRDDISTMLARAVAFGADPSRMMDAVGGYMIGQVQRRFETETGPDGSAWVPLSPRTANARVTRANRRGYDTKLLVDRRLYVSITQEADASSATVGTNDIRAAVHQFGASIAMPERQTKVRLRKAKGRTRFARKDHKRVREVDATIGAHTVTIPARPYLGFADADRAEIAAIALDVMEDAISGGAA